MEMMVPILVRFLAHNRPLWVPLLDNTLKRNFFRCFVLRVRQKQSFRVELKLLLGTLLGRGSSRRRRRGGLRGCQASTRERQESLRVLHNASFV